MNIERAIILGALLIAAGLHFQPTNSPAEAATAHAGVTGFAGAARPEIERSAERFEVDNHYSSVNFRVMHMKASNFYGRFNSVSGVFKIDDANLDTSMVDIEVDVKSVDTNGEDRNKFLMGQAFFSVKEFPKMTFKSTAIQKKSEGVYSMTGMLTLHGVTKKVNFDATHTGTANVSPRWGLRSGYEAIFEIDRKDFGMAYGTQGGFMASKIQLTISLHGMLPKKTK